MESLSHPYSHNLAIKVKLVVFINSLSAQNHHPWVRPSPGGGLKANKYSMYIESPYDFISVSQSVSV